VFLHIADKNRLFTRLHTALRPGGKLLFTDYCCGPQPWSAEFRDYVAGRGYSLHSVAEYADLIAVAGFEQVGASDETARFVELLQAERDRIDALSMPLEKRDYLKHSWQGKIQRAEAGDQRWGLFSAVKAI
jgi:phosphoethanolamine N-methyltransferase